MKKRTDQWTGEAGATDHKTHPEGPHDADADDRRYSEAMEGKFSRAQPIPPKLLDPAVRLFPEPPFPRHAGLQRRLALLLDWNVIDLGVTLREGLIERLRSRSGPARFARRASVEG